MSTAGPRHKESGPEGETEMVGAGKIVTGLGPAARPPLPFTSKGPEVAPKGTVTLIENDEFTVKSGAAKPLIVTELTPNKPVPVITIVPPGHALEETEVMVDV